MHIIIDEHVIHPAPTQHHGHPTDSALPHECIALLQRLYDECVGTRKFYAS